MRACFLGRNVCALGFGVAMVQSLPLEEDPHSREPDAAVPKDATANVGGAPARPYIHRQFWTVSKAE